MTTQINKSTQKIFEETARVGPAYLWLAPPLDPVTGLVTLSLEGNDSYGFVGDGIPRPASGGMYLGYDEIGVTETPIISYETVPIIGSSVPFNVRIKEERAQVKTKLLFNNETNIISLFRSQGFNNSLYQFSYGGRTDVMLWPLLLIIVNQLNEQDYVECHYYHRGYFEPASTLHGKLFSGLDMTYNAISGLDANGCLLPAGQRIMKGWFVRVELNGDNILIAPTLLNHFGASSFLDGDPGAATTSMNEPPALFGGIGGGTSGVGSIGGL